MPSGDVRRQISLRFWSGLAFSVLSGGVFGACCSLAINYALVEVSLSPLFAVAFGVLFLATGAMVAYQVALEPATAGAPRVLLFFAAILAVSGALCFVLERDWSHGLSRWTKVPLYGQLGVSVSFSVHFSALDLIGRLHEVLFDSSAARAIIRTPWQAKLLAVTASFTGLMYGLIFGVMGVEDVHGPALCAAFHRESRVCMPAGAAAGALAATAAQLLDFYSVEGDVELRFVRSRGDDL